MDAPFSASLCQCSAGDETVAWSQQFKAAKIANNSNVVGIETFVSALIYGCQPKLAWGSSSSKKKKKILWYMLKDKYNEKGQYKLEHGTTNG